MVMRMRSSFAAIIFALVLAAPADAGWEATQWGMSPNEAMAVLDGAVQYPPQSKEIHEHAGKKYAPLIKLSHAVEGVSGQTLLLFDVDRKLRYVMFNPTEIGSCDSLVEALTSRYGVPHAMSAGKINISDWSHGAEAIKLTKVGSTVCNLSYSAK
ncbi:hypothetical protein [Shinella sedimenti]|uniref:Uncharacterized protein n=1 Tax=Shinella sedimenti TaxID=2919913 RepID=A0ABT0CT14_9HYPH|nr:hypothetical protein [Shinella sedimenti]MCJ8151754.1 hypothetical protein [Shinella sedimenti]